MAVRYKAPAWHTTRLSVSVHVKRTVALTLMGPLTISSVQMSNPAKNLFPGVDPDFKKVAACFWGSVAEYSGMAENLCFAIWKG